MHARRICGWDLVVSVSRQMVAADRRSRSRYATTRPRWEALHGWPFGNRQWPSNPGQAMKRTETTMNTMTMTLVTVARTVLAAFLCTLVGTPATPSP